MPLLIEGERSSGNINQKVNVFKERYPEIKSIKGSEVDPEKLAGQEWIAVAAGDGRLSEAINSVVQLDSSERPIVIILGGGFYSIPEKQIRGLGHTISLSELADTQRIFDQSYKLHPGKLSGDTDRRFTLVTGIGGYVTTWAEKLEKYRKKHNITLSQAMALTAGMITRYPDAARFECYIPQDTFIPGFLAGPKTLGENEIAKVEIKANNRVVLASKSLLTVGLWFLGKPVPDSLMSVELGKQFKVAGKRGTMGVVIAGDFHNLSPRELTITRDSNSVQIVSLPRQWEHRER